MCRHATGLFFVACMCLLVKAPGENPSEIPESRRVTLVTFMNELEHVFGYLQVSAAAHGLHPKILGYGEKAWWPDGLGAKVNALRLYVMDEVSDSEVLMFVDAFDVLVFGGRQEIVENFEALEHKYNRSLFFNAEKDCFPPFKDICTDAYPQAQHARWRYLNSGVIVGRGRDFKLMLHDPVSNIMPGSDQAFYQRYFRDFPGRAELDRTCVLACATLGVGEEFGIQLRNDRLVNTWTGKLPSVVHFVSDAHWPRWIDGRPTTEIQKIFQVAHPDKSAFLFDKVSFGYRVGGTHKTHLTLRGSMLVSWHWLMQSILCMQCRIFMSRDRECRYVGSLLSTSCSGACIFLIGVMMLVVYGIWKPCNRCKESYSSRKRSQVHSEKPHVV